MNNNFFSSIMNYLVFIWFFYKEKFVLVWLDGVRYYGYILLFWVEGVYVVLKRWIEVLIGNFFVVYIIIE